MWSHATAAPLPLPGNCPNPLHPVEKCSAFQDYVIVCDNSDSIQDTYNEITQFMDMFIDLLDFTDPVNGPRVAIITFSGPTIGQLSNWAYDPIAATNVVADFTSDTVQLKAAVRNRVNHYGLTCISCGIEIAGERIRNSPMSRYHLGAEPIIILLTDGEQTVGGTSQRAIDEADAMKQSLNVRFFAVSYQLGAGDPVSLAALASSPSSTYFWERANPADILGNMEVVTSTLCTQVSLCTRYSFMEHRRRLLRPCCHCR